MPVPNGVDAPPIFFPAFDRSGGTSLHCRTPLANGPSDARQGCAPEAALICRAFGGALSSARRRSMATPSILEVVICTWRQTTNR
jgi:hypothetical protein